MSLAIIVPTLNEGAVIGAALAALQPMRTRGVRVIVVDGHSEDETSDAARPLADDVLVSDRGRARQMNAGARAAGSIEVLLFLHADTRLPPHADRAIAEAVARGARWGRFDVSIDGRPVLLRSIATLMNLRSRLTGICTGDQAMFVERSFFETLGGFPDQPLMEDVEFSRRARPLAGPVALASKVTTSGRRWERDGVWRTIVRMWLLRWRYWRGADPAVLAHLYREAR